MAELFSDAEMNHKSPKPPKKHEYKNTKAYSCSDCWNMDFSQKMYSDSGRFYCTKTGETHFPDDDACGRFRLFNN
jgi:hypothetical protein